MTLREKILKQEKKALEEKVFALEFDHDKKELPIPLESIASLQNSERPILDAEIYTQVVAGMAAIKHADKWAKWGFKSGNSVLLFTGPPGTGKTTTARWVAKHLRTSFIQISMGDIGSQEPGSSERNLKKVFVAGVAAQATLFFDECDSLLWDRAKAGEDSMWMVGLINFAMTMIERYPYLIILASNFPQVLDKALARRVTFEIKFTEPGFETRKKLWAVKWPKWPLALPIKDIPSLANLNMTGDDIEHAIEEEARYAIIEQRKPSIGNLKRIVKRIAETKNPPTN